MSNDDIHLFVPSFRVEEYGAPTGSIVLYGIDPARGEAEWGRLVIDPDQRSRGLATRALRLLVRHARELGLRRLRCEVLAGNPAERLYRDLGFTDADGEGSGPVAGGERCFRMLVMELGGR